MAWEFFTDDFAMTTLAIALWSRAYLTLMVIFCDTSGGSNG